MSDVIRQPRVERASVPTGVAFLGLGMGESVNTYEEVMGTLAMTGFDVYAYACDSSVLFGGDPELLKKYVAFAREDFKSRTANYPHSRRIHIGFSIGALPAWWAQLDCPQSLPSFLVAAGVEVSKSLANEPGYRAMWRRYYDLGGWDEAKLETALRGTDMNPRQKLVKFAGALLLLGTNDRRVNSKQAEANVKLLNANRDAESQPIELFKYPGLNHDDTLAAGRKDFSMHLKSIVP